MVLDNDFNKPQQVAHCCKALNCCVWRYTVFVL